MIKMKMSHKFTNEHKIKILIFLILIDGRKTGSLAVGISIGNHMGTSKIKD